MKLIDLPPIWLAFAILIAWAQARFLPIFSWPGGGTIETLGNLLVVLGLLLMAAALWEFWRAKTTPIPHQEASALIVTGVFKFTRNPIYLGDACVLLGLVLRWEAAISLVLVPAFVLLIQHRFIRGEEMRLRARFGEEFDAYTSDVRRWI